MLQQSRTLAAELPPLPSSGRYGKRETVKDIRTTNLIYETIHPRIFQHQYPQVEYMNYSYYEYDHNGQPITRTERQTFFF